MEGFRARTILVVDDDALMRRLLLRLLLRLGCEQVHEASSAAQGVELLAELEPDLVLTDLSMETGDAGFTLARAATRAHIDVAIVSGNVPELPPDLCGIPCIAKEGLTLSTLEQAFSELLRGAER